MGDPGSLIRAVPDFPLPGIVFRDITPLLNDAAALRETVAALAEPFREEGIEHVAGIESRGFIFGAPLAIELGAGFIPVRKLGKLPRPTIQRQYSLEYGANHLEMHLDALEPGQRVLLVDDLLATGGTARACADMLIELEAELVAAAFVIELEALHGRELLSDHRVLSLIRY